MSQRAVMTSGDLATIGVITIVGFAAHDEIESAFLLRIVVFFVVLSACWLLVAGVLGVLNQDTAQTGRFTWRIPIAALIAAPLAALLRSLLLWIPLVPVFVAVIAAVTTAGLTSWRLIWSALARRFNGVGG